MKLFVLSVLFNNIYEHIMNNINCIQLNGIKFLEKFYYVNK